MFTQDARREAGHRVNQQTDKLPETEHVARGRLTSELPPYDPSGGS
jgi:hypothetical protein